RFLHRLHGEIFGRLDDNGPLATDPGDDRWPVFVVVAPPGLAFLAAPTRSTPQRLLPTLLGLAFLPGGVIERAGRCRGLCRYRDLLDLKVHVRIPTLKNSAQLSVERPHSRL